MNKIVASTLVLWLFFMNQVAVASAEEVRARCIELFMKQCNDKCLSANGVSCPDNCQENADNQCREAGE